MSEVFYVALGSNLGDRAANLSRALDRIAQLERIRVLACSAVEETEAITIDGEPGPRYLNQMVALNSELAGIELLAELQRIEAAGGRTRQARWAPRTIDLDIVDTEGQPMNSPELTVPHPELPNREFWRRELEQVRIRE